MYMYVSCHLISQISMSPDTPHDMQDRQTLEYVIIKI